MILARLVVIYDLSKDPTERRGRLAASAWRSLFGAGGREPVAQLRISTSRVRAWASPPASRGDTTGALCPSAVKSAVPPEAVTTKEAPHAIASAAGRPHPS